MGTVNTMMMMIVLMIMMMIGDHFEDFEEKRDFEEMLFQPCTSTGATLASRWTDLTL